MWLEGLVFYVAMFGLAIAIMAQWAREATSVSVGGDRTRID